ncbi:MAG: glycosyltransferase family 2 protein [Actinomycetota bacterium]
MKVAVIMRTFERPVLLARAIASVCQQTHGDWELVVVNNGGDPQPVDGVVATARNGSVRGTITVVHLPERVGMEAASNAGLRASQSEFFAIHDDDDAWHPDFLAATTAVLSGQPERAGVVTSLTKVIETMKGQKVWPVREEPYWLNPGRLTFRGMIGANTFPPIAALFRRSVLDDAGWFDESLPVLGDWEFNLRAVRAGGFAFEPRVLARYHVRTQDSDRSASNSIVDGELLHRSAKLQLQDRWLGEIVDGVNKGLLSVAAQAADEATETRITGVRAVADVDVESIANRTADILGVRRPSRRLLRGLRHPGHAVRAVKRILRG